MKVVAAIDPGARGAIAFRDDRGRVGVDKMPETLLDLAFYLDGLCVDFVIVEDVGYHIAGNNASASCKFARACGAIEGILVGRGIPFRSVRPQQWQRGYTLPRDKSDRKRKIKEIMQRRYPSSNVTLDTADALAILTWFIEGGKCTQDV